MHVSLKQTGDFKKTTQFLNFISKGNYLKKTLERYGKMGVDALASATPVDTGLTASSWGFEIEVSGGSVSLIWTNDRENEKGRYKVNIVYLLVNGHGTGTGGWVEGRDFITPAIEPVMKEIIEKVWEEVKSA